MTSYVRFYLTEHLGEHMKSKRPWQFDVLDVEAEMTALTNAFSSNAVIP